MKTKLMILLAVFFCAQTALAQGGAAIVRVDDPFGSHCIDATTEAITVHVRRVFTQKEENFITEDKRAGVVVTARLIGTGAQGDPTEVKIPSVSLVSIQDEPKGRVSLALEYQIANNLKLNQGGILTSEMQLSLSAAKKRGKNTFGQILDVAGDVIDKLPIPANPWTSAASKFLEFTNNAVDASIKGEETLPFGEISLSFNRGSQPDLNKCKSAGHERTGAFAVLLSKGIKGEELIPTTNTDLLYCFTYSSIGTYELLAAKRLSGGACPGPSAFKGVPNDYTMFLLSASSGGISLKAVRESNESRRRCRGFGLPLEACGVAQRRFRLLR